MTHARRGDAHEHLAVLRVVALHGSTTSGVFASYSTAALISTTTFGYESLAPAGF